MPVRLLAAAIVLLSNLPAVAGDAESGAEIYQRCIGCHAIAYNRTGPKHAGLFGRQAGTVEGFAYSSAMRQSGIVWNEDTLDAFLAAPREVVPGTKMTYAGVADADERADLIAYLKEATKTDGGN